MNNQFANCNPTVQEFEEFVVTGNIEFRKFQQELIEPKRTIKRRQKNDLPPLTDVIVEMVL